MRLPVPTEDDEHLTVAQALSLTPHFWFHPANELPLLGVLRSVLVDQMGKERAAQVMARVTGAVAGKLARMGVVPGIPDFLSLTAPPASPRCDKCGRAEHPGAFIELKRRNAVPSDIRPEQVRCIESMRGLGWVGGVARGADEAIDFWKKWGYLK